MSGYIGTTPVPQASQTRDVFTATASQTTFATSGYTVGFLDVYVNGVHLKNGTDYAATNGSDVVMTSGLDADDYVEVVAFTTFSTSDTVSASGGGTFSGSIGIGTSPSHPLHIKTSTDGSGLSGDDKWAAIIQNAEATGARSYGLKIMAGSTVDQALGITDHDGSNDLLAVQGNGIITQPKQPAFQVTKSGHQSNIAVGSATVTFDTEIFDQASNFASNTFTAPVTGKYQLSIMLYLDNLDSAANYYQAWIATSNRGYYSIFDPDYGQDNGYMFINASILADMDANDTAFVGIEMGANGNAQTDINATTKFSGYLVA